MDIFDQILRENGLLHLKDDIEELRLEILKKLGLSELKDSPVELMKAMEQLLEENKKRLERTQKNIGKTILDASGRRN